MRQKGLEIRCRSCERLLRKFEGDEPVRTAWTVGSCCAADYKLPQAACYPTPPEPLE